MNINGPGGISNASLEESFADTTSIDRKDSEKEKDPTIRDLKAQGEAVGNKDTTMREAELPSVDSTAMPTKVPKKRSLGATSTKPGKKAKWTSQEHEMVFALAGDYKKTMTNGAFIKSAE